MNRMSKRKCVWQHEKRHQHQLTIIPSPSYRHQHHYSYENSFITELIENSNRTENVLAVNHNPILILGAKFKGESLKFSGFFPHFFIERFHAGDEVKNKHLTFSYKRQGILSGMLKTHKLTQKINTKLSWSYFTLAI